MRLRRSGRWGGVAGKIEDVSTEAESATCDIPTAWAIQREVGASLNHHAQCSSVPGWCSLSGPGLLCDCGAVEAEWRRRQGMAEATDREAARILDDVSACIWVGAHCVRTGRQHLDAAHGGEPPT